MRWMLFVVLFVGVGCSAAATAEQPSDGTEASPGARSSTAAVHLDLVELEADLMASAAPRGAAVAPPSLLVRYIANTGASGVARRDACEQDARSGGAWAEGTQVRTLDAAGADCVGWSLVDGPGAQSWVRDGYLSEQRPPPRVAAPGPPAPDRPVPEPTKTPAVSPHTMTLVGFAPPGSGVSIYVGGRYCDFVVADAVSGLWGRDVGPASSCGPVLGEPLTFVINGALAAAVPPLLWTPGAGPLVTLTP